MLFKGSGVRTTDIHTPDMSTVSTPPYSMVSDSDDPLHDESILQQLFYSNTLNLVSVSFCKIIVFWARFFLMFAALVFLG